jgi:hypothetical protein
VVELQHIDFPAWEAAVHEKGDLQCEVDAFYSCRFSVYAYAPVLWRGWRPEASVSRDLL